RLPVIEHVHEGQRQDGKQPKANENGMIEGQHNHAHQDLEHREHDIDQQLGEAFLNGLGLDARQPVGVLDGRLGKNALLDSLDQRNLAYQQDATQQHAAYHHCHQDVGGAKHGPRRNEVEHRLRAQWQRQA
nr:hypothetical protein [Tanacetum cinerariifolium]